MAKTQANLATETRIYLDESSQLDFLDSEVLLSNNRAYHDVVANVMEVYENFYETTTPYTYAIVLNQQEYTIDPSLIKVTRVEINYNPNTTNSKPVRAIPIKSDELRRDIGNTNSSGSYFNCSYYLHGNIGSQKIGFVPIPTGDSDTGGTKSISVWGISLPGDLVNTTDDVNIPYADRFAYLISLRSAAQLLRKGQQEEAPAAKYMAEYQLGLQQMRQFLKGRQSDDVWMIEDAAVENTDFSTMPIV